MIKVSVIVPVYNAMPYLRKCVESILAQDLEDLEIILVDDGSTDGSGSICDEYGSDPRVVVIHQNNRGASAARNTAMNAARGEYIGFVDADDYIERDMFACLYETAIEYHLDVVLGNYNIVENDKIIPNLPYMPENKVLNNNEIRNLISEDKSGRLLWFACKSIFSRKLLFDHAIFFEVDMLGEDTIFDLEALLHANSVYYINRHFYNYVQTPNSQIRSPYKAELISKLNKNYIAKKKILVENRLANMHHVLYDYAMSHSLPMLFLNEINHRAGTRVKAKAYKTMRNVEMIKDVLAFSSLTKIKSYRFRLFGILLKLKHFHLLAILSSLENNK